MSKDTWVWCVVCGKDVCRVLYIKWVILCGWVAKGGCGKCNRKRSPLRHGFVGKAVKMSQSITTHNISYPFFFFLCRYLLSNIVLYSYYIYIGILFNKMHLIIFIANIYKRKNKKLILLHLAKNIEIFTH